MPKILRQYGIFLLIPGMVLVFSVLLKLAQGPYWLAPNFDPSYQYLVNGLYLIKGLVPNHADHPGTPLQMLCAVICRLFNMGRPADDVVAHVAVSPEFYLGVVFSILTVFSFLTSVGLAIYVFRKTNDRLAALLSQLPALSFLVLKSWETSVTVIPIAANVSPEPLLIGILNLFNLCLLMNFFADTSQGKSVSTCWWALASGWAAAVKLTFVPLLAVPLIVLSWKNKIFFLFIFAASFVLWTLPVVSKYPIIFGWISNTATHSGTYGEGGGGIFSYLLNWKSIIVEQKLFIFFLLASAVLVLWRIFIKKADRGTFFLAAIAAGIILQFTAVTQHPGAHYLLPGLGLFSGLLVLFYLQGMGHDLFHRAVLVFILMAAFLGAVQAVWYDLKLRDTSRQILAFHQQDDLKYRNCTFIDYYRASGQDWALFFGDAWNLAPQLGQDFSKIYPNSFFFSRWGNTISGFNGRVWANDLLAQNSCVLFRGDGDIDFSNGPYQVQLLEKGPFESLHLITATSEKQAAMLLAGALQFFQHGEYEKAMACALQARQLHYQPAETVDKIISLFGSYGRH